MFARIAGKIVALDTQAKIDGAKIANDGLSQFATWATSDCSGAIAYVSTCIKGEPSTDAYKAYGAMTRHEKLSHGPNFAGF